MTTRYKWIGSHRYPRIPLARFRMQPEQPTTIQRVLASFDRSLSMTDSPSSAALPAAEPGGSDPSANAATTEATARAAATAAPAAAPISSFYSFGPALAPTNPIVQLPGYEVAPAAAPLTLASTSDAEMFLPEDAPQTTSLNRLWVGAAGFKAEATHGC
ncbi:TPA: hypothetical protein ACH3X1_006838 [Trebouxia sp. C0004]